MNAALITLIASVLTPLGTDAPPTAREILDPFTGHWRGTFRVYTYDGRLVEQLEVEQCYRWDSDVQIGEFIDTYPDGRVVRAEARNYEKNGQLLCEVVKDNGERSLHQGRYTDGRLFWFSKPDDGTKVESFKEAVIDTEDGLVYTIDGFGIYGDTHLLFEGRYHKVKPSLTPDP